MVVSYLKLLGDTHTQTTQYFERHEQYSSYKISRVYLNYYFLGLIN